MPFITIIGVIKVEHLWAKCNVGLAGFLWTTAPLVFKYIGLKALRHLDPCDPLPPPQEVLSLSPQQRRSALAVSTEQGHLSLPLIYIYFPRQLLFIGALRIWHISLTES